MKEENLIQLKSFSVCNIFNLGGETKIYFSSKVINNI